MLHWLFRQDDRARSSQALRHPLSVRHFSATIGSKTLLQDVSFDLVHGEVLSIIGPTRSGKSSLLRAMCRMLDGERGMRSQGEIWLHGENIYGKGCDLPQLRRRVGMVSDINSPFPLSIWDNIVYGLKIHRLAKSTSEIAERVEIALRRSFVWDELKDDLHRKLGTELGESLQRRLCLARALALNPEVLLLDRPAGGGERMDVDVLSEMFLRLKQDLTIVTASPSLNEAARVSDRLGYLEQGRLIEIDTAEMLLTAPLDARTRRFIANSPI